MGQAGGGTTTRKETYISSPTQGSALINNIFQDLLGRKASQAQKESPATATYSDTASTTLGGLDSEQYLLDKIAATDEAKATKVLGFYNTFMNALGSK